MNVKKNRLSIYLLITAISAGVFSIVLGIIVLVGWYTGNKTLIQVLPVFVPMQYNTALGFTLCGTGMLLGIYNNRYITLAIGIVIICLGGLTLLEYISGLNIGIDELFMKHDITVMTSQPGRMAPNTATCFILIGSILTFSVFSGKLLYQSQYKSMLASLVFGLSVVALSGYLTHIESAYGWGSLTRMALHTSIGFIILSIGVSTFIWRSDIHNEVIYPDWLPIPTAIGALTITVCFWQALRSEYSMIAKESYVPMRLPFVPTAILTVGILLSFVLGLAVYLYLSAYRRTRELAKSNQTQIIEISERQKAEESLARQFRLNKTITDNAASCLFMMDKQGHSTFMNPAAETVTGYTLDEIRDMPLHDAIHHHHPDGRPYPMCDCPIDNAQAELVEMKDYEDTFIRKDGSFFPVICYIAPLEENGKVIGSVLEFSDVTEQKKMEDALLQSEKLKSIGTITAGISHEFNNLLAIISGNVQLLEGTYKDDKVLTDALITIMKATNDGAAISRNMLKFTKTKSDIKELVSADIRDLIRHSIDFTKPRWSNEAQARGINYIMDTESMKSVPSIMCKHAEMREIFINIINNALDAMPGGGSITFSTWSDADTVLVSVTDNGEGMSENVKKNIFDPFFSTKGVDGTGLGMSMAYGIVSRHGGKIDVASEIGNGTTFTLQFPATNKGRSLIEVPDTEQETNVKSLQILVVDDEEAILDILNQLLSRIGCNVKTIDNGADAINMIEGGEFDLVLCDLAMPNVSGYDVAKAINGLKKRPKLGIVTGWCEEEVSDKDVKVDFYLRKPFKHEDLIKHLNELFGAG